MCKLVHPLGVSGNGWLISITRIFPDDSKNRIRTNILVRNILRTRIFVLIRFFESSGNILVMDINHPFPDTPNGCTNLHILARIIHVLIA